MESELLWATECDICRNAPDDGGLYVINYYCYCRVDICTVCFDRLYNCPFCRKSYGDVHRSLVAMNERERQQQQL